MGFMNNYNEDIEWCEDTNGFEPNVCDFLADYDAYLYSLKKEQELEACVQELVYKSLVYKSLWLQIQRTQSIRANQILI